MPSLRQLKYLVALAETGHFRQAAERCGITQPSLSVQVSNLEDLLAVRLLERGRGPLVLTPAGREVVARARRVVAEVQGIVDLSASLRSGLAGTIRLGTTPTLGPYLLPHVAGALHRAHPELSLYVREAAPRDLLTDLASGTHDVILTQLPVAGDGLVVERLFREPLSLAVARDHPLAARAAIADTDLDGLTMLALGPAFALHDQISTLCRDLGAVLDRDYEGTSLDALRQMVGMGMGATFLPKLYELSEVGDRDPAIAVRPFRRGRFVRAVGLVWRRATGKSAGIARIAETLRAVARDRFGGHVIVEAP